MSEAIRILTMKAAAGSQNAGAVIHAADAARLSGFVDGSEIWLKPFGAESRAREPVRVDRHQAISGPGVVLLSADILSRLALMDGAVVEISSAKPRRPSIHAVFRYEERAEEGAVADDEVPLGVPPELLPHFPRRRTIGRERLIVLFDNSGSMSGRPLDDAKASLQTLLQCKVDRPDPLTGMNDEIGMIRFGQTVEVLFRPTVEFVAEIPAIMNLTSGGGTPMEEALRLVPEQFNDSSNRWVGTNKRCMIITDGGAEVSDDCIALLVRERIEVVAIAIGTGTAPVLQSLAAATGGDVVDADSLWKLDAILARLA